MNASPETALVKEANLKFCVVSTAIIFATQCSFIIGLVVVVFKDIVLLRYLLLSLMSATQVATAR